LGSCVPEEKGKGKSVVLNTKGKRRGITAAAPSKKKKEHRTAQTTKKIKEK